MKTITITIEIKEQEKETLKGSIIERIETVKINKLNAEEGIKERVKELIKIKNSILDKFNQDLGEGVWFEDKRGRYYPNMSRGHKEFSDKNRCFAVSIGFRDGIYRNTCFNVWDLYIQTPLKEEVVLGQIKYREPKLDTIEMYLVGSDEVKKGRVYKIENIEDIHTILEDDYITYFSIKK